MAIPKNKEELITAIEQSYTKLVLEFADISNLESELKTLEGHAKGSQMSIKNLLAYLIGWGELVLKWNRLISNNEAVKFPDDNYSWVQLGELAQKFYQDYQALEYDELISTLDKTVAEILALIQSKTNKELYQTNWYKNYSMGRMVQLNTSSPYKNARTRIRKWKKGLLK